MSLRDYKIPNFAGASQRKFSAKGNFIHLIDVENNNACFQISGYDINGQKVLDVVCYKAQSIRIDGVFEELRIDNATATTYNPVFIIGFGDVGATLSNIQLLTASPGGIGGQAANVVAHNVTKQVVAIQNQVGLLLRADKANTADVFLNSNAFGVYIRPDEIITLDISIDVPLFQLSGVNQTVHSMGLSK